MDNLESTELEATTQAIEPNFENGFSDLDFLDSAQSGEPEAEKVEEQETEPELDSAAVVGMVGMGLFMSEQYISGAAGVDFSFDEQAKEKFLEASAPLVAKYGLTWLGWFENYKEELLFGMATFGLGYSSLNTIKRLQAEKIAIEADKAANDDQDTQTAAA